MSVAHPITVEADLPIALSGEAKVIVIITVTAEVNYDDYVISGASLVPAVVGYYFCFIIFVEKISVSSGKPCGVTVCIFSQMDKVRYIRQMSRCLSSDVQSRGVLCFQFPVVRNSWPWKSQGIPAEVIKTADARVDRLRAW